MSELPAPQDGAPPACGPVALGMGAAFVSHAARGRETIATIERALDLGIDYFDSYAGRNEERWGRALSGVERSSYYMQAKVGPHHERPKDFSAEATRWSVEQSLQALRVDYLDARPRPRPGRHRRPAGPPAAPFDELQRMKEEGLVRHNRPGGTPARLPPHRHRGRPRRDRPHFSRLHPPGSVRRRTPPCPWPGNTAPA